MLDLLTNHSLRFFPWYETVYYLLMKRVIKSLLLDVCTQQCTQKPLMLTKKYKWSFLSRTDKYWIYGMLLGKKISKRLFSKWIFAKTTSFCRSKKHISLFNDIILLIGMKKSFYDNQAVSLFNHQIFVVSYQDYWWETYQVEYLMKFLVFKVKKVSNEDIDYRRIAFATQNIVVVIYSMVWSSPDQIYFSCLAFHSLQHVKIFICRLKDIPYNYKHFLFNEIYLIR